MTDLDPKIPPAGEEIHLPGPTILPLLLTVGITMVLLGVTTTVVLVIVGLVIVFGCIARWIADTRRDIAELPLEHRH